MLPYVHGPCDPGDAQLKALNCQEIQNWQSTALEKRTHMSDTGSS